MAETLDEIKKYVGPFSGPQMDQIFYEILNYTSERFAKGTAGGVPVAAGTPGYNDNSLFYKNQAAAQVSLAQAAAAAAANSAQRAESAVPAGTDAAVLWTRDQSTELTADDKAVARKNIMAGGTNPNLLDNPWFTVNQRGFTSSTGSNGVPTVDRWAINNGTGGTVSLSNGIVTLNANAGSGNITFEQHISDDLTGKTVTLSVLDGDDNIYSATGTIPAQTSGYVEIFRLHLGGSRVVFQTRPAGNPSPAQVQFYVAQGNSKTIKAVKLELGSVSTLANDTAPKKRPTLADCRYYFRRIQNTLGYAQGVFLGLALSATQIDIPNITSGEPMRTISPTITSSGTFTLSGAGSPTFTSLTRITDMDGHVGIRITGSGFTPNTVYKLNFGAGAYIDISADL